MKKSVISWVLSGSLVLGSIAAVGLESPAMAHKKNKQKAKAKASLHQHSSARSGDATGGNGTGGNASTTGGRSGTVQCIFVPGVAIGPVVGLAGPFCSSVAGGGGVATGGVGVGGAATSGGAVTGAQDATQTQVPANANTQ